MTNLIDDSPHVRWWWRRAHGRLGAVLFVRVRGFIPLLFTQLEPPIVFQAEDGLPQRSTGLVKRLEAAVREEERDAYQNMLVSQLREECKGRGIDATGKKAELVERLVDDL